MTTALNRFMTTATAILDEQDRKAAPKAQPPFFIRTTWLFAELEELALSSEAAEFEAIKVARHSRDLETVARLVAKIRASSEGLSGQQHYERRQFCDWIKEQIEQEPQS